LHLTPPIKLTEHIQEKNKMKFNTPYTYKDRKRIQTVNNLPTMTKQSLRDNADINHIIKRHGLNSILKDAQAFEAQYGDFDSTDLQDAMNVVANANSLFEQIPSEIRNEFKNDAGAFIDFATDPENHDQMAKWGLANPKAPIPEIQPTKVEIINPEQLPT